MANHQQIKCKSILRCSIIDNLHNITIVIGNIFVINVKGKNNNYNEYLITNKSDIKIQSIEPLFGLWTGGTTVKIKIKNHLVMRDDASLILTVAGRKCTDLIPLDNETITCIITPVNTVDLSEGPVEVVYNPLPSTLKITSSETFKFVDPEISGFYPVCGPLKGGTKLTVSGKFLNVSNTARVFVDEDISCETIARDQNRITCLTGSSAILTRDKVKVEFDRALSKYAPNGMSFVYTGNPTLVAGQQFTGIATGGTTIQLRGYYFSCFEKPKFYVDQDGIRHFENCCQVKNNSYMQCRSPKLNLSTSYLETPTMLNFGFQTNFADHILYLTPQPDFLSFVMYPDPVFTDFVTDNNSIIINGHGLNQGYLIKDMTILLRNSSGDDCQVTLISRHRIDCELTSSDTLLDDDLHVIVISIGDHFVSYVEKLSAQNDIDSFKALSSTTIACIAGVSLLILFICALVFCLWSKKKNR